MRRAIRISLITLAALATPVSAFAVGGEDEAFVLNGTGQKFFALPTDRNGGSAMPRELKSDAKDLQKGFIALDRDRVTGPRRVTTVHNQVNTVRGTQEDKDVLSLFESELSKDTKSSIPSAVSFKWPLPSNVEQHMSSGYGMRSDPFKGSPRFHGGVDIAAPAGTAILAAADGRVKENGYRAGFGNYIILTHADGSETMYNHLQKSETQVGMAVRAGQEIGKLGTSGRSTGPHLDFRLKVAGVQADPMNVLAGKQPLGVTAVASNNAPRTVAPMNIIKNGVNVREQRGVRIISPQQRVAMSGGFIRVR